MTDRTLEIPPDDLEKIIPILDALEAAFRPLTRELPRAYAESE